MPDETPLPVSTPENPGTTATDPQPGHESDSTANLAPETSFAEKVGRAAESVFQSAGLPFKRGRGRPPTCQGCGKPETKCRCAKLAAKAAAGDLAADLPSPALAPAPAPAPVRDPALDALFRRSVASAVKGLLGFAKGFAKKKAGDAGLNPDFTEKALREADPEPEVLTDFSDSLETVLKKYNASTEYSPEIALAISVARLGSPYVLLIQTFNAEIARKKRAEMLAEKEKTA